MALSSEVGGSEDVARCRIGTPDSQHVNLNGVQLSGIPRINRKMGKVHYDVRTERPTRFQHSHRLKYRRVDEHLYGLVHMQEKSKHNSSNNTANDSICHCLCINSPSFPFETLTSFNSFSLL